MSSTLKKTFSISGMLPVSSVKRTGHRERDTLKRCICKYFKFFLLYFVYRHNRKNSVNASIDFCWENVNAAFTLFPASLYPNSNFSLRVGAVLDHFGYPAPSITEWQQHMWYDLGATHSCVYEMRNRLAMGHSALPRPVSPATCATSSVPAIPSHPRVGQKALKIPPKSAPAASTTRKSTDTSTQSKSAKGKDKRKKRKKEVAAAASSSEPKRSKKQASPVASSDTEIDDNQIVPKEETSPDAKKTLAKRTKGGTSEEVPPMEFSDSQAEGPFTNHSDSEGTESAPESKGVSSSRH